MKESITATDASFQVFWSSCRDRLPLSHGSAMTRMSSHGCAATRRRCEQIGRLFMLDYRSTVAAAAFAGAVLAACADPDLPTDLRTSGPPNITTVTVLTDLETSIDPAPQGIG